MGKNAQSIVTVISGEETRKMIINDFQIIFSSNTKKTFEYEKEISNSGECQEYIQGQVLSE
jgi:hypothetical protein